MKFRRAEASPSFPELEKRVGARWKEEHTFEQSLERSKEGEEFVFYDGPPFPTGMPHHGTLFVTILKDLIPRYKTMRGYYVPRGWGWDCHGLPVETQAEKNLGITDKTDIEKRVGVKAFNDECRRIVSKNNESWAIYIDRIGRWVDFEHPYRTLDRSFMESVIWAFSESYKKNLIYKDYRVSAYCYRCQTPLSISDTRLDDSTRPVQDRTITVRFPVVGRERTYFLAWTTTPWTLPSNLALAVGANVEYSFVRMGEDIFILATNALKQYERELPDIEVIETATGAELNAKGFRYRPIFPYFQDRAPDGFPVLIGDFVSTEEGTGIVHIAPAFGEDDYWLCKRNDIALVNPVDEKGCFTSEVPEFEGKNVHAANADIIRFLKGQGIVLKEQTVEHNYPHCWRCRTPLIYRALDAWYYNVEAIKERLLANNELINWYPESVKEGRFRNWLENARDWNISRNRYWATPIPVWECSQCDHREVLGSVKEIESRCGREISDLHKEFLDEVLYPCPSCGGEMRRVSEVLDGWFESGSMPYGQFHYPFENKDLFESHFPCDFIVEYTAQLRGWFYVLHVLSTGVFDRPSFRNCMVHGTLLAADGKKMSKSMKNFTDPLVLMDQHGADAFRAYLVSSNAIQMADLAFKDEGVESVVRTLHLPLWNALLFFTTYAEIDNISTDDLQRPVQHLAQTEVDTFILSEVELLITRITEKLDSYLINDAARMLPEFLDTLNNWYIRRSRQRVWTSDPRAEDKLVFYTVLYRVLTRFAQVLAPFCPFLAESVWERLGFEESVHLSKWPVPEESLIQVVMSEQIASVRKIITAGLAIRARERIRVRQPLQRLRVALHSALNIDRYVDYVREELNVKTVEILSNPDEIAQRIGKPDAKLIGRKFGKATQDIIRMAKEGRFTTNDDGTVTVGDYTLQQNEIEIVFIGKDNLVVESTPDAVIALDTVLTPELEQEGYARDLVRHIQEMRKEADLNISDRIEVSITGADDILEAHGAYIQQETLTRQFLSQVSEPSIQKTLEIAGRAVDVALKKA